MRSIKQRVPLSLKVFIKSMLVPVVPRDPNPYATHMPVLIGLAKTYPIRRVVEFGSGHYSTRLFLDRRALPDLQELVTYETDAEWLQKVAGACEGDSRVRFVFTESPSQSALELDFSPYDLIFIDDSLSVEMRAQTIAAVTSRRATIQGLVAIHDFEQPAYQQASAAFRQRFAFRIFNPEVGLLWENAFADQRHMHRLAKTLKQNAKSVAAEDVDTWLGVFSR